MKPRFKRIYIEITDYCNLNCSFCSNERRNNSQLSIEQFNHIIKEVSPYTNEIYLHVLGEPLMHPHLNQFLELAKNKGLNINVTTNGTLLSHLDDFYKMPFDKMNISLHSSYQLTNMDRITYLKSILTFIEQRHLLFPKTVFNLRLWANSNEDIKNHNNAITTYLSSYFQQKIVERKQRLKEYVILTYDEEFTWPNLKNEYHTSHGTCLGGRTHIAILVNGDVVLCCLDASGATKLGNIFINSLADILNSEKFKKIIEGFQCNVLVNELCQHCTYHERKK